MKGAPPIACFVYYLRHIWMWQESSFRNYCLTNKIHNILKLFEIQTETLPFLLYNFNGVSISNTTLYMTIFKPVLFINFPQVYSLKWVIESIVGRMFDWGNSKLQKNHLNKHLALRNDPNLRMRLCIDWINYHVIHRQPATYKQQFLFSLTKID